MPNLTSTTKKIKVEKGKVSIERQCYHVELDITDSGLRYQTGDHIGTWPENDSKEVLQLIKALRLSEEELDQVFKLTPNPKNPLSSSAKLPFPVPCTVRTALTHYLELKAELKQYQMEILAKFAGNEKERDALFELADNRDHFLAVMEKGQKNLAQCLLEFPSVKIPLVVVLGELLPRVGLRYYSISSSSKESPNRISLTAVIVRYALATPSAQFPKVKKQSAVIKQGLTTSWFERIHEAREENPVDSPPLSSTNLNVPVPRHYVPIYIRTSHFKLPKQTLLPVVMVGPGTGVAPFRGFVRERFKDALDGSQVGPTWLFFGCRKESEVNFIFLESLSQKISQTREK